MAELLKHEPRKGILKNSSSFEGNDKRRGSKPSTKWDEMNIIATLHPADKDYGHMKIDEPKTPYNYRDGDEADGLDADVLTERLKNTLDDSPKALASEPVLEEEEEEDDEEELSPLEKEERRKFEMRRKMHYNEFQAVKLARQLMEQDEDDDDEEEEKEEEKKGGDAPEKMEH